MNTHDGNSKLAIAYFFPHLNTKDHIFEAEQALAVKEETNDDDWLWANESLSWWENNYLVYFVSLSLPFLSIALYHYRTAA